MTKEQIKKIERMERDLTLYGKLLTLEEAAGRLAETILNEMKFIRRLADVLSRINLSTGIGKNGKPQKN